MSTVPPSQSGPSTESITERASTGVQGGGGVNFGKLVWIEGSRLYVQVDTAMSATEAVTLRVDLSPVPGTAMLRGTVMRVLPTAPGEPLSYLVRLETVAGDDQVRWQQFLRAKRSGGTLNDLSDVRDSTSAMRPTYPSVADKERRAVLDKMAGGRTHPSGMASASQSNSTATWSSSAVNEGGGRAAMRDALKAALTRTAAPAATGAVPPAPPSTRYVVTPPADTAGSTAPRSTISGFSSSTSAARQMGPASRPAPVGPPPAPLSSPPGVAVPTDPVWLASNLGGTTYVQVEWRTPEAFSFDVHTQLSAGILTLQSDGRALPQTGTIFLVLKHQGILVQVKAAVSEHHGFTATYRLELDASHLAELRRGARSISTVSGVSTTDPTRRPR